MNQETQSADYSSIANYYIGEGSIIVTYNTGCGYLYNSIKPGIAIVNQMINIAKQGAKEGLGEYIKNEAAENYYRKLE